MKYVVPGDPISLVTVTECESPQIWSDFKQRKFNYRQSLKNQHNYRQFIDSPIKLDVTFYIQSTYKHPKKEIHSQLPPIVHLFNFVNGALQGIAYRKDCAISKVTLKKVYDSNPRTEITVTRL
jgi:Holliday junction resolvase RusA-like endonuclease